MPVRYLEPLHEGIDRMKGLLLNPFDVVRWFVLGFAAWLANLAASSTGDGIFKLDLDEDIRSSNWDGVADRTIDGFRDWLHSGLELAVIFTLAVVVLLVTVLVLWLSARGQFIWLDNLVAGRAAIRDPWSRWRHLADSFFLWRICFAGVILLVILPLAFGSGLLGLLIGSEAPAPISALFAVALGGLFFLIVVSSAFIDFWAEHYVTIIMFKHNVGVLAAWRIFRRQFERQPGHFVLVGLFYLVLWIGVGAVILAASVVTCCIAAFILAIPYVGTVLMLPIYASFRYFDLAWLGQFDPDLQTLPPRQSPDDRDAGRGDAGAPSPPAVPPSSPNDDADQEDVRPG